MALGLALPLSELVAPITLFWFTPVKETEAPTLMLPPSIKQTLVPAAGFKK